MFNWVAFGRGEREFSLSISIPYFSTYSGWNNEAFGRAAFGIVALLADIIVVFVVVEVVKDLIKKKTRRIKLRCRLY